MNNFGIIIDDNTNVTEVIAKPITVQEMAKLARQTTSKKAIQHFVEKFQSKNVKNLVKLIQTSKIPIYFYALFNPEEKHYDWYIIDASFNQMLKCSTLDLDRIGDWFTEDGEFL